MMLKIVVGGHPHEFPIDPEQDAVVIELDGHRLLSVDMDDPETLTLGGFHKDDNDEGEWVRLAVAHRVPSGWAIEL